MEGGMPIEEALMALMGIDIFRKEDFSLEKEKGIPFISLVLVRKCVGKTILPLNGPFLYLYCYGNNLRLSPSILPPSAA